MGIETGAPGVYPTDHNARERKLLETARSDKNITETFQSQPVVGGWDMATGLAIAAEPADALLLSMNTGKAMWELYYAAIESTGTAVAQVPVVGAGGLTVPQDANHTDGVSAIEMTHGTTARSQAAFTVGTDEDFYMEATIAIADISDLTSMFYGFRKAEAYQANPESYDEMATFQIGGTADGQFNIWTILNNAATTKTDTTLTDWLDAGSHTLRVDVAKSGIVTFTVDDAAPTVTQAFRFDDGEVVLPFIHVDGETGDAGVVISNWKVGKR
jgi:hypothetical protein